MSFEEKLEGIVVKHQDLADKLGNPGDLDPKDFGKLSKEYSDLTSVVEAINIYKETKQALEDSEEMLADGELDAEMKELVEEELQEAKAKLPDIEHKIKILLLPKDEADAKNAILEVRAGTGGDEAALFAGDLFEMYKRYSDKMGWKFEIISASAADVGGFKEASASISGTNVFERLKFESGVHRVQRVPSTETQGRVHTSAATVAVLPEAEEVDVELNDADIRVDIFRASGPGGQSVNTTDSAVRLTHIPTGIVVSQQDEKSQHKNKAKAMRVLLARVYDAKRAEVDAARSADRKSQIGSGDRSERIRTYNFPQGRVSDHRINLTLYKIAEIVAGGDLDELVDALTAEDQAERLSEVSA